VLQGIEKVLTNGPKTPDMGGTALTRQIGEAIAAAV
jgi:tartrate dehydrogenase/decarboxylase/D-malate dehydrogenase